MVTAKQDAQRTMDLLKVAVDKGEQTVEVWRCLTSRLARTSCVCFDAGASAASWGDQ